MEYAEALIRNQLSGTKQDTSTKLANHLNCLLIPIYQAIAWFKNSFDDDDIADGIGKEEFDKYFML